MDSPGLWKSGGDGKELPQEVTERSDWNSGQGSLQVGTKADSI